MRRSTSMLLALPAACALGLLVPSSAFASQSYQIQLNSLSKSGATGTAMVTAEDNGDLKVQISAHGLVPGAPHAQHLHGSSDLTKDFMCPTAADDTNGDGIISTVEGVPDYGNIFISLTTKGDTSPNSGLAVDRFPVADKNGDVTYSRTIKAAELPKGTIAAIKNLHIVQHGIDANNNGTYDFDAGKSALDPKLPLEATAVADCGMIEGSAIAHMPSGGVETGTVGGQGVEALPLLGLGAAMVVGSGALVAVRRRRVARER